MSSTFTIGQIVTYTDTKGHPKPALVLGTIDTIVDGTDLPVPTENEAHLTVFGFGKCYTKLNVPSQALVEQMATQGNTDFAGGGFFTA